MKLVFCKYCGCVFSLNYDKHKCYCERSWGHYKPDGLNAVVGGGAIPIGFENSDFAHAITKRPKSGAGKVFEAFVIPDVCPTIEYSEEE